MGPFGARGERDLYGKALDEWKVANGKASRGFAGSSGSSNSGTSGGPPLSEMEGAMEKMRDALVEVAQQQRYAREAEVKGKERVALQKVEAKKEVAMAQLKLDEKKLYFEQVTAVRVENKSIKERIVAPAAHVGGRGV